MGRHSGTRSDVRFASRPHTSPTKHAHPLTRRSSLAVAAALTTMALTTTAAAGLGSGSSSSTKSAAVTATPRSTAAATPSPVTPVTATAVEVSTEVDTAVQAADQALADAQYAADAPVDAAAHEQINQATSVLRDLVADATTEPVLVRSSAASRGTERTPAPADAAAAATATAEPTSTAAAVAAEAVFSEVVATGVAESVVDLGTPLLDADPVVEALTVAEPAGAEAPVEVAGAAAAALEVTSGSEEVAAAAVAIQEATAALRTLLDTTKVAAVSVTPPPPTPEEIAAKQAAEAAARAAEAAAVAEAEAARFAGLASAAAAYGNGQIPGDLLCDLSFAAGEQLRCDAAAALERLNVAFAARFGRNLGVNDSYRSYADQVATKAAKGYLAAIPGTSNHGLGLAVDLTDGIQNYGSAEHEWMRANAGAFGWEHPAWARPGGSKPEPWHWEFGNLS